VKCNPHNAKLTISRYQRTNRPIPIVGKTADNRPIPIICQLSVHLYISVAISVSHYNW